MTTVSPADSGSPSIRQATTADLLEVYDIEQSAFPQPWPFDAFEQYVGTPGFLVAEEGTDILGYVVADTVSGDGRQVGHIKDVAVRSDRRQEGIGSSLLGQALTKLESEPITRIKLEVREGNEAGRNLYRRHGFVYRRTLPEYYADGEDALVLVRPIRR